MPPQQPGLPPKPEVALALLESAPSLYIHLDPRPQNVLVPAGFKKQPQLVLQVGLNMAVPIMDLDVGEEGISCTLSFNRRSEFCRIPWDSIFGLVGEDGRGMIWPESVPPEVAASAEGRTRVAPGARAKKPKLRLASAEERDEIAAPEESKAVSTDAKAKQRSGEKLQTARKGPDNSSPEKVTSKASPEEPQKTDGRPPYLRLVK